MLTQNLQDRDETREPAPRDFIGRSDLRSWLAIGRDWSIIIALIVISEWAGVWWFTGLAVLGIGALQFALGEALLHDASHYNLFGNRSLNDRMGLLYALPFLTTVEDWRAEHLTHHRSLGMADDHIVQDYSALGLTSNPARPAWVWFGKPIFGITAIDHLRHLWTMNATRSWVRIGVFWGVVAAVCVFQGVLPELMLYWFLPMITVFATLLHWSEIADHYRTQSGTRSRTSRVHNWLWHNNGYHATHHEYPAVPFHRLRQAHQALGDAEGDSAKGWWAVWRQISRPHESAPERWARFWPPFRST